MSSVALKASARRTNVLLCVNCSHNLQQTRNATLLRRPKRPYTFTQLVMLTDGSAFMHRTTSPIPVYRSNKDVNNAALWNPSSEKLLNVEEDEAGKLSAFRSRFGRNWDSAAKQSTNEAQDDKQDKADTTQSTEAKDDGHGLDHLMDLISDSATHLPVLKGGTKPLKKKK